MKSALAFLLAGALAAPAQTEEAPAKPDTPNFEAVPLCRDGEVVGVQIYSNRPVAVVLTWDRKTCAAHDA